MRVVLTLLIDDGMIIRLLDYIYYLR